VHSAAVNARELRKKKGRSAVFVNSASPFRFAMARGGRKEGEGGGGGRRREANRNFRSMGRFEKKKSGKAGRKSTGFSFTEKREEKKNQRSFRGREKEEEKEKGSCPQHN